MTAEDLIKELNKYADDAKAEFLQRFFKTGPGEYAEGDMLLGVRVPDTRRVCRQFRDMDIDQIQLLYDSPFHEHRLAAAIISAEQYKKADTAQKQLIYDNYLKNLSQNKINNWDIVDVSCYKIIGRHLINGDRKKLFELAKEGNLWERRAAMVSTFAFIRTGDLSTTIQLSEILLDDRHALIQKAVGWMLRETGKVDVGLLEDFLEKHAARMPRTMLRYSIEKLSPEQKQKYMLIR